MIAAAEFVRPEGARLLDRLAQLGVPLADLTADSRAVKLGSIFVAYPGTALDGRAFITEALARGAAAILWERTGFTWNEDWEVPNLGVENLRGRISEIAGHVYGNPSESLWMAGVTGTNGKTSVSQWIAAACDALGRRSAVVGTLGNGLVGERVEGRNTTPDPIVLQRLLADYLRRGARNVAMEVSSHGLDQGRVQGIKYDVAVFTNLTRDHLDYHGTMEAYAEAKYRLFSARGLRHAVVNVDDPWGAKFVKRLEGSGLDIITFGTGNGARLLASQVGLSDAGVRFRVEGEFGSAEVRAGVLGAFNVSNLLAVLGALLAQGIAFDDAIRAVSALAPVPGRLERVGGGAAPLVVIDYAHTPDALDKALAALRPAVAAGHRLVCVFGCGGDRDPGKRPLMGSAAARLADHVIVTSDNPRSEDPHAIIEQILAGIPQNRAESIEDRQVAIFSAVHHARAGDVVLLAGKGHETYQEIAGTRHPFNDREVAGAALAQWEQGSS
ncbi:MAG TPA: UDP-N-acetylmuramoyl-L-alanyl-D-glutamate--2,6-diaminopimelate ligase [Usitatibacter sp.]|jgi:UDP-N-acetylmuramoyl-L-alanyl-D-glutamate--2,6-diaminopimelate ligase|nr:UDP-N-acetylmuramoyl-L-alanyl-D-glutamate--2,6-diaminopimelate ligase [Usitatibacter sp.]